MGRFSEVVLLTEKGIAEGFIRGFFKGRGDDSLILNLEKEEIAEESFKEILEEFLHPAQEVLHLMVEENKEELLKEAIIALKKEGFVCEQKSLKKHSKIKATFEVEIYDSKRGKEIKKIITEQKITKISFQKELKEIEREQREKLELYAPEHSYELKGKGTIEGDIETTYKLIKKLRDLTVIIKNVNLD